MSVLFNSNFAARNPDLYRTAWSIWARNVTWRHKIDGVEVDVFLKSHNVAVEFDGYYWHQDKIEKDKSKMSFYDQKVSIVFE